MFRGIAVAAVIICASGCASSQTPPSSPPATEPAPPSPAPPPAVPSAPWQQSALRAEDVPSAYLTEWRKAANRSSCALIAPARPGAGSARAATFSGGWAVAYDTPSLRSAFGVAGSGSSASDQTYEWPNTLRWSDGSRATYGPEGGTGPNELAYVRIAGQGCLYNVWSRLGRAHLEQLLGELRFVRTDG